MASALLPKCRRPSLWNRGVSLLGYRGFAQNTSSAPQWRPSAALDEWVQRDARPISLRQLTFFGRTLTEERLISSANYVRMELPTRLAHRLRDMQTLPYIVVSNQNLSHVYELYYRAFERFRRISEVRSIQDNDRFCKIIKETLTEHLTVIPKLAMGVLEIQDYMLPEATDKFVTTMLRSVRFFIHLLVCVPV
jgi:pyruvate dehydrogenase kinase 2/3/4